MIRFSTYIKPACLWTENDFPQTDVISMGYDKKINDFFVTNLIILSNEKCNQSIEINSMIPYGINENQICATTRNKIDEDKCQVHTDPFFFFLKL